jgi:dynein heavy chain
MEGARWDIQQGIIMESKLKELFPSLPVVNIRVSDHTTEILFVLYVFCVEMLIAP